MFLTSMFLPQTISIHILSIKVSMFLHQGVPRPAISARRLRRLRRCRKRRSAEGREAAGWANLAEQRWGFQGNKYDIQ